MTIATTFDTLAYAKRFKAAGFTDSQAEEVVAALRDVRDSRLDDMATKGDVQDVAMEVEKVRREISDVKAEIIKWMFGVAASQAMFIIAILKMFPSQ